jgi:hypothetical protein
VKFKIFRRVNLNLYKLKTKRKTFLSHRLHPPAPAQFSLFIIPTIRDRLYAISISIARSQNHNVTHLGKMLLSCDKPNPGTISPQRPLPQTIDPNEFNFIFTP